MNALRIYVSTLDGNAAINTLDEFHFTTAEKENFGKLKVHSSEFHE
jgi:hypothetical protein